MPHIQQHLPLFIEALESNQPINCTKSGKWRPENLLGRIVRRLEIVDNARLLKMTQAFCSALDDLERKPVLFGLNKSMIDAQRLTFLSYLKAADALKKVLLDNESEAIKLQLQLLAYRVVGLKYRMESINGGLDRQFDQDVFNRVLHLAGQWKYTHPLSRNGMLTQRDISKIIDACAYPEFAKLLFEDQNLQDFFFSWCIRENNGISQFVEFPATTARLKRVYLTSRISRYGGKLFALEKRPVIDQPSLREKIISLPFYIKNKVEYVSILDENRIVELRGDMHLTIAQIFKMFSQKKWRISDVELLGSQGITNWHSLELGWWNASTKRYEGIDLSKKDWWEELPVFEEISKEEVQRRYDVTLDAGDWLAVVKSVRQTTDLDFDGQHGYLEVIIPTAEGRYNVYPFGKSPPQFPTKKWEKLFFLVSTKVGKIRYPDENALYSHCQTASHPIVMKEEQARKLMAVIRNDIIKCREGETIYQFGYENCAGWVETTMHAVLGDDNEKRNYYKIKILESEPSNFLLKKLFNLFRRAPNRYQPHLLAGLDRVLGSSRGITVKEDGKPVFKSMRLHPKRNQQIIFHPGYLHKQIENGSLKGNLVLGH